MSRVPTMSAFAPKTDFRMYHSPILGRDGTMYMDRYVLQTPWFTWRLHKIMRADAATDLHTHPWSFVSILLTGRYIERVLTCTEAENVEREKRAGRLMCAFLAAWNTLVGPRECRTELPVFTPVGAKVPADFVNPRFRAVFHFADDLHRIIELPDGPVWTLVFTGPHNREWGFQTKAGWVPWHAHDDADTGGASSEVAS